MASSVNVHVLNTFWVNFCTWCKIVVQFHFFACICSVFPTPFIGETVIFLHCIFLALLS